MSGILNLARWEWFKLQRRKMLWVLLAILLGFTQLAVWGSYVGYTTMAATGGRAYVPAESGQSRGRAITCRELQSDPAAAAGQLEQCRQQGAMLAIRYQVLSPTGSVVAALAVVSSLGLILFGVLTASVVGSEYGVGTLRPILSRGTGRLSFLAGKYLTLLVVATVAAAVFCGGAAASGWMASQSAPPPPSGSALLLALASNITPSIAVSFLKAWAGLVTFITMTGAITLLLRSTAAGMAICLAWYVGEGILIRLLTAAFPGFESIADFLPMRNISALTNAFEGFVSSRGDAGSIDTAHASLVLAAYVVIFASIAAIVFRRRDIAGAAAT